MSLNRHLDALREPPIEYRPELRWWLAEGLHTDATLTDQGELTADLATIRHTGVTRDAGEWQAGLSSIAAPVFGGLGEPVAALALAGPSARLTGARMDQLAATLAAEARALGRALGG